MRKSFVRAAALAAVALLLAPAGAAAKTALVELRVEGPSTNLDPGTWYVTGPERARKSKPSDECVRSSGTLRIPGPTPLSLVASAESVNPSVSQVRVRRDEAGLFVCEIGSILGRSFTDPAGFAGWTFYEDYVFGSSAADVLELQKGDNILWVFSDFGDETETNTGDVLELKQVPARSEGVFEVKVVGHRFDGSVNPVEGATIHGAESVAEQGNGRYLVEVAPGTTTLWADRGVDVASNRFSTCTGDDLSECPKAHGRTIVGSARGDDLPGTRGFDDVAGRGGDDKIDLTAGGRDTVDCGAGSADVVVIEKGDGDDDIAGNCEKVRRA
jgi:hypothetical protein